MAVVKESVKPLDLDAIMGKPKNRVARIGVELEGGWNKVPSGTRVERDGSVFNDNPPLGYKAGEIPLGPMQVGQHTKAMTTYYPQLVDDTCGMHVHMSFETTLQYNLLADSEAYQETVIEYLARWAKKEGLGEKHAIWNRLLGKSDYCQKKFWPQEQMFQARKDHDRNRTGHRYTAIHYCWTRTGTVECRILPMMKTVEQAISAIKCLVNITNAYLIATDHVKVKEGGKVELDNGDVYEEYIDAKL